MTIKKKGGLHFKTRGSNKKYPQLDDIDRIKELLFQNCPADVARMEGVPYNCIGFLIREYLSPDEQDRVCWKRQRHTNNNVVQ